MCYKVKLFLLVCFLSVSAFAQQDSVIYKTDEIVVYGNKVIHSLYYSPADVKIFTKDKINNLNGGKLYDVINYCGGIHLKSYAGINSLKTISFNGLGAEQTAVLLNGVKLNSQQNSQVDLSMIPMENVERVEIISGGMGSLYGSDASGGIINIRTEEFDFKNEKKYNFLWRVNSSAGNYGYYFLNINSTFLNKNGFVNVGYSKEKSNNNYDYFFFNGVYNEKRQRENASFTGDKIFLNSDFEISKNLKIKYYGYYYVLDRNLPSALNSFFMLTEKQKDRNFDNILQFVFDKGEDFFLKTQLAYQENIINYEAVSLFRDYYNNKNYVFQLDASKSFNQIKIYSGVELNYNKFESESLKDIRRTLSSIFLTGEYSIINNFRIFPSIRFESASDVDYKKIYSKIGINYKPFYNINFHIRSSLSNNGRIPTFNDLYWVPGGNKNLKPESAVNFDIGFIYGINLFGENLIELSYTNILMTNKITWLYNPELGMYSPVNIGKSKSNIISASLKSNYKINTDISLNFEFNYTFNYAKKINEDFQGDLSVNKQLPNVPLNILKSNLSFCYKDIGINLFYNLIGKRYTDSENNNSLNPAGVLDANLFYNIYFGYIKLRLSFEINNITNTDYSVIEGYPMPLRNVIAKISIFN